MKTTYKSLYPSVIGEFNISRNTQIGKINILEQVYDNENAYGNDKYTRGGEFVENLTTDNIIEFAHRWLHLANIAEFLEDMVEYETHYTYGSPYNKYQIMNNRLITNAVYDLDKPVEALSDESIINALYVFSDLEYNDLSNSFDQIIRRDEDDS